MCSPTSRSTTSGRSDVARRSVSAAPSQRRTPQETMGDDLGQPPDPRCFLFPHGRLRSRVNPRSRTRNGGLRWAGRRIETSELDWLRRPGEHPQSGLPTSSVASRPRNSRACRTHYESHWTHEGGIKAGECHPPKESPTPPGHRRAAGRPFSRCVARCPTWWHTAARTSTDR